MIYHTHPLQATLIKVAGAGLDPYKHLGKTLHQLEHPLYHYHTKCGLDLCGEGGEYETIGMHMATIKPMSLHPVATFSIYHRCRNLFRDIKGTNILLLIANVSFNVSPTF